MTTRLRLVTILLCAGLASYCGGASKAAASPLAAAGMEPASTPYLAYGHYGREPPATPNELEAAVLDAVQHRLGASTRLVRAGSLILAARELARRAAQGDRGPEKHVSSLRFALASALAPDPSPVASLTIGPASGDPAMAAGEIPSGRFTHAGAGAVISRGQAFVVVLLSSRTIQLSPFPREIQPASSATLRGRLLGLGHPAVHVTSPLGKANSIPTRPSKGNGFEATIRFDTPGRWLVEVVGRGAHGPEVAALLTVSCGSGLIEAPTPPAMAEPPEIPRAERQIVAAINATRGARDLPPLESDEPLAKVARAHSETMLSRGILAHVLRGTGNVHDRLRRAGIPHAVAHENVARAETSSEAHLAIEESPAHLQNVLSKEVTRVGCGIARGKLPGGRPITYLTEIFTRPVDGGREDRMTPEGRVREAIWAERARLGLPSLISDPVLDGLARDAARKMLASGRPSDESLAPAALELGRNTVAVDSYVNGSATAAARSRNLPDRQFKRIGVGVAVGDHPKYGTGALWIATVYTD